MKNHEPDAAVNGTRRSADDPAGTARATGSPAALPPIPPLPFIATTSAAKAESTAGRRAYDQATDQGESA